MERIIAYLITWLFGVLQLHAQHTITGTVTYSQEPVIGANVFIVGTIDGCMTQADGTFSFTTDMTGVQSLRVTSIGFDDYTFTADVSTLTHLDITLREHATSIDEVVVTASTFHFGKSDNFKSMDALDIVMAGNSCGDIIAALQTLPGTQRVGEDGKLYVRGGDSEECQTFINGMHVLVPYNTSIPNSAVRGRFSPFLFKGINFSLGGYDGEYGQALSSILPMETTDEATSDKLGVSGSCVDWNIGGTKVFSQSSLSFNADYTSLALYNKVFGSDFDWVRPYRKLSMETQYKSSLTPSTHLKTYVGYDLTSLEQRDSDRRLSLAEHNLYANATMNKTIGNGFTLFTGIAGSWVFEHIDGALTANDRLHSFRQELHLKARIQKAVSPAVKWSACLEDYYRHTEKSYRENTLTRYELDYHLLAGNLSGQWRFLPHLFLQVSSRMEYLSYGHQCTFLPRSTVSYVPNERFQLSAGIGRYTQVIQDDYLAQAYDRLPQSTADHAVISMQWIHQGTTFRLEPYYKRYCQLPLFHDGAYGAEGTGNSKGFDLYIENHSLVKNLSTTLSYSFNDSRRRYLDFVQMQAPTFASRHNVRFNLRYALGKVIIGMANTYASGRTFGERTTPHYHTLDMNVTYLLHEKVILYTSLSNILGRNNIFRYEGDRTVSSRQRFFYFGIFVSLKNNKAYDISNF